jgi:chromosomal replication initiation ATPase DnaA
VANLWDEVLEQLRGEVAGEDYRRWFSATSYASDAGDLLSVWVPSQGVGRLLETQYTDAIRRALEALGRAGTSVRFVVAGYDDEDEDDF